MRLATTIAIACLTALPAAAQDDLRLILDWYVNPDHAPIIVAQERGLFAEHDLAVEIIPPADPSDPPRMVAAGGADLGVSYQPDLYLQTAEGLPLTRVGTLIATPLNCLLVRDDGPVESIADLEGRSIGFSVAGVEEALLSALLRQADLTLEDVDLINVNFSLAPALMSGQVDAVIGAYRNFELNQMAINDVPGRCFYLEEHGIPAYDELIYIANPERMNEDVIARFLAATEQATFYIVNHPDEAWEIFAGYRSELDDELNRRAWDDTWPRLTLAPAGLDWGRYAAFGAFMADQGLIPEAPSVDAIAVDLGRP